MELKHRSRIFDSIEKSPNRAMLRAIGMKDEDFKKPLTGIASHQAEVTPCNIHLDKIAEEVRKGILDAGGYPILFHTITVSDGIAMGTTGMKYSLPSRDIIADSIEIVVNASSFDAFVAIGGCDKNMPGSLIAMCRIDIPSIFVYGGTISPGYHNGKKLDIVSVFEAVGEYNAKKIGVDDLKNIERYACPGEGACGGMYTANTMATAIEALGLSIPGSSSNPAASRDKLKDAYQAGMCVIDALKNGLTPRKILTKKSFENAIAITQALGGSTNAVLHLIAIARAGGIKLSIDDFERIGKKTPHIADLKPSGKYVMEDLYNAGGVPAVIKLLIEKGLLHGDTLTITGKTLYENVRDYELKNSDVVNFNKPLKERGPIVILRGNLAPEGAVAKTSGVKRTSITGPARVFDSEEEATEYLLSDRLKKGEIIVIRYEGPKGGPGMREMLAPTSIVAGKGLSEDVGLITDGRFSGGTHGCVVGHVCPEAQQSGPIGVVKNGDTITIDLVKRKLELHISGYELKNRLKKFKPKPLKYKSGILYHYAKNVKGASEGAILHD